MRIVKLTTIFALIYFAIIAILYFLGTIVPDAWPSFIHANVLIPVTLSYAAIFFYVVNRRRQS